MWLFVSMNLHTAEANKRRGEQQRHNRSAACATDGTGFWVHLRCKVRWKGMRCNKIWIIKINVNDSFIRSLLRWLPVAVCVCAWVWWLSWCALLTPQSVRIRIACLVFVLIRCVRCNVCVCAWEEARERKKGERLLATLNVVKYSTLWVFPFNNSQLR